MPRSQVEFAVHDRVGDGTSHEDGSQVGIRGVVDDVGFVTRTERSQRFEPLFDIRVPPGLVWLTTTPPWCR